MPRFDHVVLTAANEAQARGYRAQLRWRRRRGAVDADTAFHVVADPDGRRVGSLGATLHALAELAPVLKAERCGATLESLFAGRRVLICHSGGDSRRLPAYAAQGKVFTPLPTEHNGIPTALFDLILGNVERLPAPEGGQVLIYVGDVLLTFDPAAARFDAPGVVGLAYPGSIETGSRHGVYVADEDAAHQGFAPVADFLQKPDEATAQERGAIDPVGRVLIDTGVLSFDPKTAAKLLDHAGVTFEAGRIRAGEGLLADLRAGRAKGLDLYEELLLALAPAVNKRRYRRLVAGDADAPRKRRLDSLFEAVRRTKFHVNVLPYCDFFHVGSSREFLANIASLNRTSEAYGFANMQGSLAPAGAGLEGAFLYNTIIDSDRARASASTLSEAVDADVPLELPGRNILVGMPRGLAGSGAVRVVKLREGVGLVVLPIDREKWAAVCFGVRDDFKGAMGSEAGCGFLNDPIERWLERHGVEASALWPGEEPRTLWDAAMWRVGELSQVVAEALWVQGDRRNAKAAAAWRRAKRVPFGALIPRVNHDRLIEHRQDIHRRVELASVGRRMLADDNLPAASVVERVRDADEAEAVLADVVEAMGRGDDLFAARALKLTEMVCERFGLSASARERVGLGEPREIESRAFGHIAAAVRRSAEPADAAGAAPRRMGILHDQVVWVTTPVRLDFSGGWSDTPPFCTERGGTVVNAAITLNGQYPLQCVAKLNDQGVIRLSSIDLGQTQVITTDDQLRSFTDPTDWGALPKAAMVLSGLAPEARARAGGSLRKRLEELGGGIDLTLFSAVPKGSGLGTSSILGAAVLACLHRVLGREATHDELIAQTSVLEQMMTTGGGWQDQVGGVVPGVKLIQTVPGPEQRVAMRWAPFDGSPDSPMRQRLMLYFTGQKRLAKNILQNVVGRYLARDPEAVRTIDELKDAAMEMKQTLDTADVDAFGAGIERYWTLKKRLDPGATNANVEKIIKPISRYCAGKTLPGAGGGGFVFMVAHDPDAAAKVRRKLEADPPNPHSRFFDFNVDPTGLKVTVL